MTDVRGTPRYDVERLGESRGHCDCCGHESRSVWGMVHEHDATVAAYWIGWTSNHLEDLGAVVDLVVGTWGDGAGPESRVSISLIHRQQPDGTGALMVVDGGDRPSVAASALRRDEVVGTPLAIQVFGITDAIYDQDERFF